MFSGNRIHIISAIALLLALCYFISHKLQSNSKAQQLTKRSAGDLIASEEMGNLRSTRRAARSQSKDSEATHSYAELKDFMIPELKLENATFKQALYQLRKQYFEICQQTEENPITFQFNIKGGSNLPINTKLLTSSFLAMLNTLAALEGMAMEIEGRNITFTANEKTGILVTKKFPRPQKLFARGVETTHTDIASKELSRSPKNHTKRHLENLLNASLDISSIDPLTITADSTDIARIEALFNNYLSSPPSLIKTTSHIIKVNDRTTFDPESLNQADFDKTRITPEGIEILNQPTSISRPGETTRTEIIREFTHPTGSGDFVKDHTGLTVEHTSELLGFGTDSNIYVDQGYFTGKSGTPIKHDEITTKKFSPRSKQKLIPLSTIDGSRQYLIISQEEVDPTGEKIVRSR